MSLILEALKKLEREKGTPDRGFLVVAHVPWPASAAGRGLWLGVTAALAAVGVFGFVLLRGRGGQGALPTPPPATIAPAAAATPVSAPPVSAPPANGSAASAPAEPAATPILASPPPVFSTPRPPATIAAPGRPPAPSPSPSAAGEIDLRLNAITSQDGRPVAVLNDRVVREGDVFDAIRVIRIGAAEVEVEIGGKRRVVRF